MSDSAIPETPPTFREGYLPSGVSVVIPNYNGKSLFQRTLEPLFALLSELTIPYEVIVIDDCSTDGSVAFLETHFPQIKIMHNEVNSGFSATINKGIFAAQYELVFLLNSDIVVTPGYFDKQWKYFSDKNTFGVMGTIIGWDDDIIQDTARFPEHHGAKLKTSCNYLLNNMAGESLYTFYLSGANALVSREKLVELGGFDEIFSPFYIEDCDLSFRAWRLGWKCYHEHQSICRHRTSSSIKARSRKRYIEMIYNRNKLFLHAIHLEGSKLTVYLFQMILEALLKMLLLRFSLLKALTMFFSQSDDWKNSKRKFEALQKKNGVAYSMHDVVALIKASTGNRTLVKFRSGELSLRTT